MKRTRSLAPALVLAMSGALGMVPATAPIAAATVTTQPTQRTDKAPTPAPTASALRITAMLNDSTPLMSERRSAIWQGTAKRGNRRHRTRWNYQR